MSISATGANASASVGAIDAAALSVRLAKSDTTELVKTLGEVTELGSVAKETVPAVAKLKAGSTESELSRTLASLPARLASGLSVNEAQALVKRVGAAGQDETLNLHAAKATGARRG